MAGEIFPISSEQPHYKLAQKSMFPHAQLFHEKKMSQYFQGEETLCFIIISFPISKSFIYNLVQTMAFQAKLPSHCVFKVMQYGYEIFQTVLSLSYKII